jgi:hypothetical protein
MPSCKDCTITVTLEFVQNIAVSSAKTAIWQPFSSGGSLVKMLYKVGDTVAP